ncbi:hypothetical protein R3P38DRAFT_2808154 [Favolaschia claudopus]|uniref:Uncharacterized protein n=1 Tax=Favolaschia claudopus TaxID=2862362 RepID=A0AAV9ZGP9_9AGAR
MLRMERTLLESVSNFTGAIQDAEIGLTQAIPHSSDTQAETVPSQGRGPAPIPVYKLLNAGAIITSNSAESQTSHGISPLVLTAIGLSGTSMIALIAGLTALLLSRRKKGKAKVEETAPTPARVASINAFIIDHLVPWASPPPYTTPPGSPCVAFNRKFGSHERTV